MEHDRRHDGLDRLIRSALAGGAASEVGVCPEADAVAAYADGGLEADERRSLETHLAGCARCQDVLALMAHDAADPITATAAHARPSMSRAWVARLRWAFPAAALATAVIAYIAVKPDMTAPAGDGQHLPAATIAGRLDAPRAAEPSPQGGAAAGRLESSPVAAQAAAADATPRSSRQPAAAEPVPDEPVVLAGSVSGASKALPAPPPTVAEGAAAAPPSPVLAAVPKGTEPSVQPAEPTAERLATTLEVSARSRSAIANATQAKGVASHDTAVAVTSPWEGALARADVVVLTRALESPGASAAFEVVEVFKRPDDLPPAERIVVTTGASLVRPGQPYLLFLRRTEPPAAAVLEPLADLGVVPVSDTAGPLLAFLRQRAGTAKRR